MIARIHRLILLAGLLLLLATTAGAQLRQAVRMEILAKSADRPYDVISMGTEGLALVRDLQEYAQGNKKWQVQLVDTALVQFWNEELDLDNRLTLVGFEHVPGKLFLLFRESQTTYYNFLLITMDLKGRAIQRDKIRFDLNFQLTHFTVSGTSALFGGHIGIEPAVLLFNHDSDHPKVLPGLFTKNISLLDLRANQNNSFNVLLLENQGSEKRRLILRTFDPDGNLLIDDVIPVDPRYHLLSGITSRLIHDEMLIVGTYGFNKGGQVYGFYTVVVDPFHDQPLNFVELTAIPHFVDYLPENKARKVLAKASKDKSAGRDPSYNAHLLPIRLEEYGKCFYLLAETYHPASSVSYSPYGNPTWNNSFNPYGYSNSPYRSSSMDNPGYNEPMMRNTEVRMIQSVALRICRSGAGFDGAALKFDDVKRPILDQASDFILRNDSMLVAYKYKSEVVYQAESDDPMIRAAPQKAKIELLRSEDILKDEDEDSGGLRHWYGRHFYIWGYRRVRGTVNEEVESRYVFYVNRLDF